MRGGDQNAQKTQAEAVLIENYLRSDTVWSLKEDAIALADHCVLMEDYSP